MTRPRREVALTWLGEEVFDPTGRRIGVCLELYADRETGALEWLGVDLTGGAGAQRHVYVPVLDAGEREGHVRVAFSYDAVTSAPQVDGGEELTEQEEERLYRHYGVPISDSASPSLAVRTSPPGTQTGRDVALEAETPQAHSPATPVAEVARAPVVLDAEDSGSQRRTVFVVHGHDDALKEAVARVLERVADVDVVILHEQADGGSTIIEKFERHAQKASFAVVLLTPDDAVSSAQEGSTERRARQNVILELGYFVGRLGRARVCALRKGDVALPSDYLGVLYKAVDAGGAWKYELAKELRAAGVKVDLNRL